MKIFLLFAFVRKSTDYMICLWQLNASTIHNPILNTNIELNYLFVIVALL